MDFLNDFFTWAFERHHNILSWYIRPLFLLPFCYFAYKRSIKGIIITLVALATSMFWFPKPTTVNPKVEAFLEMEMDYLFGEWDFVKIALSSLVPVTMFALAYAFWKHSWKYGILVINLIAILKVLWSLYAGDGSGVSVILPAFIGLIICNLVIWIAYRVVKKGNNDKSTDTNF
ncbi:hypothetical protein [Peribacillus asahii]|uniref:Uncharacterized protein n=1 Tax=Peribacillus asahii TaxID=228899 RepID=A0A3T0KR33_9BACI|nr:hypothetical protein [Peribacillus asahii]AZV42922.1 hypothetical protein BAOM_2313 [Peribacillus asahii]USK87130.1 hypothetical protein LIT35_11120 [Peribacillus asahii]